jgi:hypothetical protein
MGAKQDRQAEEFRDAPVLGLPLMRSKNAKCRERQPAGNGIEARRLSGVLTRFGEHRATEAPHSPLKEGLPVVGNQGRFGAAVILHALQVGRS